MSSDTAGVPSGNWLRGRWRQRRVILAAPATLVAVGAFLLWGPIGFGNGPLGVEGGSTVGWTDVGQTPAAFILPVDNSGAGPAVIDSVDLVGGTRYATPRLLGLEVVGDAICGGAWPARADGTGYAMIGCGGRDRGPLIGRSIAHTQPDSRGFPAAAVVAAPRPRTCWVITKIVVHYHVGLRHYAATDLFELAVCGRSAGAQVTPAMNAAAATS
jgi:hypothetical protein